MGTWFVYMDWCVRPLGQLAVMQQSSFASFPPSFPPSFAPSFPLRKL